MNSKLLEAAQSLAAAVTEASRSDLPFHEAAAAAIAASRTCEQLAELDLFQELALATLPEAIALENDFAHPTLTILRAEGFRIELLFWRRGSEAYIHDHMAGGAFAIVQGRRVHATFDFARSEDEVAPGIAAGALQMREAMLCDRGYVCAIPPHDGLIHSLYYVDDLAVTLSVRHICEINTSAGESGHLVYKPHEGHYLPSLRMRWGMGGDSRKLAALIESCLGGPDGVGHACGLVDALAHSRPAATLIAAMSTETLAIDSALVERCCSALGARYPSLAGAIADGLMWFGDKARFALVCESLDATEHLVAWLLTMLCPRDAAEHVLADVLGVPRSDSRRLLAAAAHRLACQEIDFGAGPEPLLRSSLLCRSLQGYLVETAHDMATATMR